VVAVAVVGVGLVGALWALVGVVEAVVAEGCERASSVVQAELELRLVRMLPPKHIREFSFSFS